MYKLINHILPLIIVTGFILSGCNSNPKNNNTFSYGQKESVFITGSKIDNPTITSLIDNANLNQGGYVVIIPSDFNTNNKRAKWLRNKLYSNQIIAVHILDIDPKNDIKQSTALAIENASLICISGNAPRRFVNYAEKSKLKELLLNSYKKGTLIYGMDDMGLILSEEYAITNKNNVTKKMKGLGFIENLILYKSHKNDSTIINTDSNYLLRYNNNSCFYIRDNKTIDVLKNSMRISNLKGKSTNVISSESYELLD